MRTNRDDFIIAIRSAFLRKGNQQKFSLIGLIFLSIILIFLSKHNFQVINYLKIFINEVVYSSSFIASSPEKYFKYSLNTINNHMNLYNDYEETKEKLEALESEKLNIDFIIYENKRLKKVLEDTSYSTNEKIAKVLIDKQSPFYRSIIINKGSKSGIKKGMAVLSQNYLVGKIVEVNFLTSRALLLSDLNSKIPVTVEPGTFQSIMSGTGNEGGVIQYSKEKISLQQDSVVFTSGTGGLFKSGIPIGKIKNIDDKSYVDFFINYSQLIFVKIVSFEREEE